MSQPMQTMPHCKQKVSHRKCNAFLTGFCACCKNKNHEICENWEKVEKTENCMCTIFFVKNCENVLPICIFLWQKCLVWKF